MKILIATDSFKGTLSSVEAGETIKSGILRALPDADITIRPLADGGEGTVDALACGLNGRIVGARVTGPLGESVDAKYCIAGKTAIIEIAAAAGLPLVPKEMRNPMVTTTYGVGELISDAISKGCRLFIIGIGGSATNDGGIGMLSALGFEFLNKNGAPICHGASGLKELTEIRVENAAAELSECCFRIACDVNNPLFGELGCSAVYAPQKGASPNDIQKMDAWLRSYSELTAKVCPSSNPDYPGAGAAGGLGFAFMSYLGASLEAGIKIITDITELESYVEKADIVITGEGRIDRQTVMGKAPSGVSELAKKHGKSVIAFAGCFGDGAEECLGHGIDAIFSATGERAVTEHDLTPEGARENLEATAKKAFESKEIVSLCK